MSKIAILNVADSGPLESLVIMLRSVGYDCYLPSDGLKTELRRIGCTLVLDIASLVRGMGYDWPMRLPEANVADMSRSDVIYAECKAQQNYERVVRRWPNLASKVLWYRINGGSPEHVIKRNDRGEVIEDCGDEVNPPCPILTPNICYAETRICTTTKDNKVWETYSPAPWADKAYVCWVPFYRGDEYGPRLQAEKGIQYGPPYCLIHNAAGWGYGKLIDPLREMGLKIHGAGSPDGLIPHRLVKEVLKDCLCMVHLKSSDAPGFSIYEALAAACPIVCTRRLIWRCKMESLFIPNKTCLVFDRETHEGLTDQDVIDCTREVREHLERLRDPVENRKIGEAGREQLKKIMWSESNQDNVNSLRQFMERHFGS